MRKLRFMSFAVLVLLALPIILNSPIVAAEGADDDCGRKEDLLYLGRDPTTLGNWIERGYGQCGYALPYGFPHQTEVAIGVTTGIGDSAHRYWWREPWSVEGPEDYSYLDYLGGFNILQYEVIGPEGAPRALVDADSMDYRPAWYFHPNSITVTLLDVPAGDYRVSLYFLDWDTGYRRLQVSVASGGSAASVTLGNIFRENFAAGIYAIFEVEVASSVTIEVTKLNGRNAVISGIFLDSISTDVTGVNFIEFDRGTKGNWRPLYGNYRYLLAGFNVPSNGGSGYPFDHTYDETDFDPDDYQVSNGVGQYASDNARSYGEYPYMGQYATYAWARMNDETASDPRVLVYPEDEIYYGYPPDPLNEKIYGQWDAGELGWPLNYFMIELMIPEGKFVLSIYAMDFIRDGRSETVEIWNEAMTDLLDSQYITSDEINSGIYVQWFVEGPRTINLKVIADLGKLNSFIDGIFLNCVKCGDYDGKTKGFWKTNIWKALQGRTRGTQVSRADLLKALNTITELYGRGSVWGFEWLTFEGSDDSKLQQAYAILSYIGSNMESKARAQILALLLTDTHYGNHFAPVWIDWYNNVGGHAKTITGWITIILNEYKAGNYRTAKNLADYLNNS